MGVLEEAWVNIVRGKKAAEANGHPFVTVSYAQSLDGSIAHRPGYPLAISCPDSLVLTHQLRAMHDAILVGIGTVLADDPQLTVRHAEGPNPQPVILDSRLRFPSYARLLNCNGFVPWIFTLETADPERERSLMKQGAMIFRLPSNQDEKINIHLLLARLAELGVRSLMVEGGAGVISSFIQARAVNQIVVCIAPFLVGGIHLNDAVASLEPDGYPRLINICHEKIGIDLVLRADPSWSKA